MKKYVSTILINAILLQLYGCYTFTSYTYEDFRDMKDLEKASIIYDNDRQINLNSNPQNDNYTKWVADSDTLRIYSNHKLNTVLVIRDTTIVAKSRINEVQESEFSLIGTAIFGIVIVGIIGMSATKLIK